MTRARQIRISVDRRTTIKWLAATMAAAGTGVGSNAKFLGDEIPAPPGTTDALLGVAGTPDDVGYGTDPDLMHPVVPWSRTMTAGQLETSAALCDLILPADDRSPAASEVGVPDFIDEWVSAPYAGQRNDRELIFFGLEWLEQQSRDRFGAAFAAAENEQAIAVIDDIANPGQAAAEAADLGEFFQRFRYLAVGAFYTTVTGMEDIGYIGNVPIRGDYPGPSRAAMTHLAGVLEKLGLSLPG